MKILSSEVVLYICRFYPVSCYLECFLRKMGKTEFSGKFWFAQKWAENRVFSSFLKVLSLLLPRNNLK